MSLAGTIVLVYHLCFSRISAGLPWRWKRLFLCAESWIPIPTHARITWSSSGFHTCVAFISLAQCHGSRVPIDHVQEKVGGVVVGLALVACGDSDTVVTGTLWWQGYEPWVGLRDWPRAVLGCQEHSHTSCPWSSLHGRHGSLWKVHAFPRDGWHCRAALSAKARWQLAVCSSRP